MADIVISYAREDRAQVQRLADTLQVRGWSVWWDRGILTGQRYRREIERRLNEARVVVVVWSRHSVVSDWVPGEAEIGLKRGVLVPVCIERIDPPLGFSEFQAADLVGWDGAEDHRGLQDVLDAIRCKIGVPTPTTAKASLPGPINGHGRWRNWTVRSFVILMAGAALTATWLSPTVQSTLRDLVRRSENLQEKQVTLNFRDADLRTVLKSCADQVGAALALGPRLTGKISIQVQGTKLSVVMNEICEAKNCTWELHEGKPPILFVNPRNNPPRPESTS